MEALHQEMSQSVSPHTSEGHVPAMSGFYSAQHFPQPSSSVLPPNTGVTMATSFDYSGSSIGQRAFVPDNGLPDANVDPSLHTRLNDAYAWTNTDHRY